jgi:hypothetical protein
MNTLIMNIRTLLLVLLCAIGFAAVASPAFADHGDEVEVISHADTVHGHENAAEAVVTSAPAADVARLQQLLSALEQLVALLKQKAALQHEATPHAHADEEHHDGNDNDEDHE